MKYKGPIAVWRGIIIFTRLKKLRRILNFTHNLGITQNSRWEILTFILKKIITSFIKWKIEDKLKLELNFGNAILVYSWIVNIYRI